MGFTDIFFLILLAFGTGTLIGIITRKIITPYLSGEILVITLVILSLLYTVFFMYIMKYFEKIYINNG